MDAAEALLHNQSNEASLEDELELLPAAVEQASEELLPSASVQGIATGGGQRVEQPNIPFCSSIHKSQQAPLSDNLQLLSPAAEQASIVLLPPGFEQEIAEVGGRGKNHWRVS